MGSATPEAASRKAGSGANRRRFPSGIPGLDEVLGGGLWSGGIYLLTGGPGTGKTVIANQLCFARAREGDRCLYVTLLAESHSRLIGNLETLAFFDAALLEQGIAYVSGARTLREGGLDGLFDLLKEEVRRREPSILVLDGLRTGARVATASHMDHAGFLDQLAALLEYAGCTAVLTMLADPGVVSPEHAVADGLLELKHRSLQRRSVRELFVSKLRGSTPLEGIHLFEIDQRGVVVYPRTEARLARQHSVPGAVGKRARLGVERLDEMLRGGLPSGSSTAILGATGAGKTLLGLGFLAEGARNGERSLYFGFYESPERVVAQGDGIGLGLSELCRGGELEVIWSPPFEHLLDRVLGELLEHVRKRGVRRLYIDGINGLHQGAAFPESVPAVLGAVINELRALGVTILMSVEGQLFGTDIAPTPAMWSPLVENLIVLRYVELRSHLRRLLWIVKVRGSDFDSSLREFTISDGGVRVAQTFESAEGILSGTARVEDRED